MSVIWATRGRTWGFRFLLDGGFADPLPKYEEAFLGTTGEPAVYRRTGDAVAVRIPDPLDREDASGRIIEHELVLFPPDSEGVESEEDCRRLVWPRLAQAYTSLWDADATPTASDVEQALSRTAP